MKIDSGNYMVEFMSRVPVIRFDAGAEWAKDGPSLILLLEKRFSPYAKYGAPAANQKVFTPVSDAATRGI